MPEVPSEPPQTVPTISSATAIGTGSIASSAGALLGDEGAALGDRLPRAAGGLDDDGLHRPAALPDRVLEPVLVEALAAERDQQHRADIGVGAEPLHHLLGIGIGVAAGKADDVDVVLAERDRDLAGDVVGALDEIADDDGVADALPAVAAQIAVQGHGRLAVSFRTSSRW